MRAHVGIALIVTVLTLGAPLAPIAPAGAADVHVVTVTPSTGLSDGQTVTVSGSGFFEHPVSNEWLVSMCDPAVLATIELRVALDHCDITTPPNVYAQIDEAGNFSVPFPVRRTFPLIDGTTVTCGKAPNDCAILVAQVTSEGFFGASAPISFRRQVPTLGDCIREFLGDHGHGPRHRFHRLLVCIFTALTHRPR
jgi:hypothetical protein